MYSKLDSLDALFEDIRKDKDANGANSSTLNRYPIRFVLFDNFKDEYAFILRMVNERGVLHSSISSWIDANYPDILITHQKLASEIHAFIKSLNGKDHVITPFSEVARFYNNDDQKEFDALIRTIKGYESSDVAWDKHQRVYIPIVGLEAKMSTFADDPQIFVWYMHNDDLSENQRLIITNKTDYGVKGYGSDYTTVKDVASWIELWKDQDANQCPNILCESRALYYNSEYARPDNAFNICVCKNVYEFLTKGLQLSFPGIAYDENDQEYWEEFASEVDLNTKFDFNTFVLKHFSVVTIDGKEDFVKLWFEYPDKFSHWLLAHVFADRFKDSYIARSLGGLELYINLELFARFALDIPDSEKDIECRAYLLNEAAKRKVVLDDETTSKLIRKLEKTAEDAGYFEAIKRFTKITDQEKNLAITWIGEGKIRIDNVKGFYPELYAYLKKANSCVQDGAEWAMEYIEKYKAAKIADTITPEVEESLNKYNGNPIEFNKWYQSLKTTRTILSSRKDIDVYFWIDGLGIDWIRLVSELVRQHEKENIFLNEVLIAKALLPSITEINKADFQKMIPPTATFKKVGNIDNMAHSNTNTYPRYIVSEIAEVTTAIKNVIQKYAGKKVAIISDHGLTYLAQKGTGLNLGGFDYHHFGRYAVSKNGEATSDSKYFKLDDGKTICSLSYASVGNKINTGQGAHGGCTPEEVLVPIFIISSSKNAKNWKAKSLMEEIVATNPVLQVQIIGLEEKEVPKLLYNGQIFALTKVGENTYESAAITNLDPAKKEFVVKVGESTEKFKVEINTGTVIEDQFADFF